MGTVYKAEDVKLRRAVALKFLAPELTRDEDAKRRFIHEAQAASALDHPNICSIFDVDETPEGQLFIAMACYEGESLKERIARRRLDVREAFEIAFSVAQGLGRAHAANIIHRDVKPANIMITSDGFVKIVDFGLAKLIGRSRVTGSGTTLGTVAYMAPEQARSEEVDVRVDVWALGVLLYEMLTGQLPFRGDIGQAMIYSILNETPRSIRELRPEVSDACAAIVMKCLEKDPARRYQSAAEFCEALIQMSDRVGWGGSFATGGVRAVSIVRGGSRRRRRVLLLAVIGMVTLTVAGTFAWREQRSESIYSTKIRLAVMPFERLGDTPSQAFVDGLSFCTASFVEAVTRARDSMWMIPYQRVLKDGFPPPDRAAASFGVNRLIQGKVVPYQQGHRLTLSLLDAKSLRVLQSATVDFAIDHLETFPALVGAAVAKLVGGGLDPGPSLMLGIDGGETAPVFVESMGQLANWRAGDNASLASERLSHAFATDSSSVVCAVRGLAHCRRFAAAADDGKPDDRELKEAEADLRASIRGRPVLAEASLWLSYVYLKMRRGSDRIAVLETGVTVAPGDLFLNEELGWAYVDEQRYDEADKIFGELSRRKPDYSHSHWCRGWVYWKTGQHALELAENQRAVELAPGAYRVLNSLGLYYDAEGNLPRAREYFEQAFLAEPNCPSCSNVGRVLYFEGRFKDSARYYEYALDYCDTTQYMYWHNLAGSLYYVEGERERAKKMYRHAIRLATRRLEEVPDDATTAALLADCYSMIGDRDSAFGMLDRALSSTDGRALFRVAQVYEHFGQRTQALHYMGEALQRKIPLYEIVNEPLVRDLVKDPRFVEMADAANRGH